MNKIPTAFIVAGVLGAGIAGWYAWSMADSNQSAEPSVPTRSSDKEQVVRELTVVAENLEVPWDIAFLPDGDLLVTERPGNMVRIAADGTQTDIAVPADVRQQGEGGLLGLVLHPDFASNSYLYLYLSAGGADISNRVLRYTYNADTKTLSDETVIIDDIPGAVYHDGGRMEFGPDGYLYITTGDATDGELAQSRDSLAGKILRLTDTGAVPADNPFGSAVYSYGHRNPQGLAWDESGQLWSTEHGRSGVRSGLDELNRIEAGANYGWPDIEGDETASGVTSPVVHSGAQTTWAPASLTFIDGSFYFGGLRGEALYEAVLDGDEVQEVIAHFQGEFGRIRAVRVGPDGLLYFTTSNRDGRGSPAERDDTIYSVHPSEL